MIINMTKALLIAICACLFCPSTHAEILLNCSYEKSYDLGTQKMTATSPILEALAEPPQTTQINRAKPMKFIASATERARS
jgi:hypothetical protein